MQIIDRLKAKRYESHEDVMKSTAQLAKARMMKNIGGPFGATVVKDGEVISMTSNSVLRDNDPTAHAEVNAIREACSKLGTYDLSGCELYATGEPCPMCLAAIMWANIKTVYVSGKAEDAAKIGFRDEAMYEYISKGHSPEIELNIHPVDRQIAVDLYDDYAKFQGTMY